MKEIPMKTIPTLESLEVIRVIEWSDHDAEERFYSDGSHILYCYQTFSGRN